MICGLIIATFLLTCFGIGIYPNIYYSCLNDPLIQSDWKSNITFRSPLILLHSIFIITIICAKLYKRTNEPEMDKIVNWTNVFIVTFVLFSQAIWSAIGFGHLTQVLMQFNSQTRFQIYLIYVSIFHIVMPPIFIFLSKEFKSHTIRILKNLYDEAFLFNIYLTPMILTFVIYGSLSLLNWMLNNEIWNKKRISGFMLHICLSNRIIIEINEIHNAWKGLWIE